MQLQTVGNQQNRARPLRDAKCGVAGRAPSLSGLLAESTADCSVSVQRPIGFPEKHGERRSQQSAAEILQGVPVLRTAHDPYKAATPPLITLPYPAYYSRVSLRFYHSTWASRRGRDGPGRGYTSPIGGGIAAGG